MKVAWRGITDSDVELLIKNYDLTETELKILQLRRKGISPIAISLRINYSERQTRTITNRLRAKIIDMYQKNI